MQAVTDAQAEQRVPGGVVLDLVAPLPEAVVRVQDGGVGVGEEAPLHDLLAADARAERAHGLLGPAGALAPQRLAQGAIDGVEVLPPEGRRLVQHLVRGVQGGKARNRHDALPQGARLPRETVLARRTLPALPYDVHSRSTAGQARVAMFVGRLAGRTPPAPALLTFQARGSGHERRDGAVERAVLDRVQPALPPAVVLGVRAEVGVPPDLRGAGQVDADCQGFCTR